MINYVIVAVLILIIAPAFCSSVKHFHGEGGCCGGCNYKARRKKLKHIAARKTFSVEGMHCQNCVNRVMEAVNSIDGASAVVKLKKGRVIVSMEQQIDSQTIRAAIEKAGYPVTDGD